MAEKKKIVVEVDVNVKPFENFDKAVENVGNSTKTLKQQLKEMTTELQGLEGGSKKFNDLAIKAGELRDRISDTNSVIKATAGSATENLANGLNNVAQVGISGFQGIASAQALFGEQSEALQETLVRLQAVAGLSSALKELGGLGDKLTEIQSSFVAVAQKIGLVTVAETSQAIATEGAVVAQTELNVVMNANPIIALITGIGLLVAAFVAYKSITSESTAEQEQLNEVQTQSIEAIAGELSAIDKLQLTLNDENISRGDKTKAIKDLQAEYPDLLSNINAETSSLDEINRALQLNGKLLRLRAEAVASDDIRAESFKKILQAEIDYRTGQNKSLLVSTVALTDERTANKLNRQEKLQSIKESEDTIKILDKQAKARDKEIESLINAGATGKKENDEERDRLDKLDKAREESQRKREESAKRRSKIEDEETNNSNKLIELNENLNETIELQDEESEIRKLEIVKDRLIEEARLIYEASQKTAEDLKVFNDYKLSLDENYLNDKKQIEDEEAEKKKIKDQEDLKVYQDALKTNNDNIRRSKQTELENSIEDTRIYYDRLEQLAIEANVSEEEFEEIRNQRINAIDELRLEAQKKANEEEIKLDREKNIYKVQLASDAFSALGGLISSFSTKSENDARKQFNINKAFALGSAVANTGLAVTAALTAGGNPIKLATGAQFIEAAIAGTVGLANIVKIANSKFQTSGGGGDSGSGSIPRISAGSNSNGGQSFNPGQFFGLGQTQPQQTNVQQTQMKVFVTETDITNTQKKVNNIETRAKVI